MKTISWYSPKPKQKPIRLPRRRPIKTVPSGIGDQGIVGNWLFYYLKGGDHLHDFTPNNNHGEITGAEWVDGRYGWSLNFVKEEDDKVSVPYDDSLDLEGASGWSIAAWIYIKAASINTREAILTNYYTGDNNIQYGLWVDEGPNIEANFYDGDWHAAEYPAELNTWYHAVATYDTETVKIFVNGELKDSLSYSTSIPSDGDVKRFIARKHDDTSSFDGIIAVIRLYKVAKSSSWISRRFEQTRGIFGV